MCDSGVCEDKPPAPPVRMSSQGGGAKDPQSANHSSRPLPSVPEERKSRNKIISMFASEKGERFGENTCKITCTVKDRVRGNG